MLGKNLKIQILIPWLTRFNSVIIPLALSFHLNITSQSMWNLPDPSTCPANLKNVWRRGLVLQDKMSRVSRSQTTKCSGKRVKCWARSLIFRDILQWNVQWEWKVQRRTGDSNEFLVLWFNKVLSEGNRYYSQTNKLVTISNYINIKNKWRKPIWKMHFGKKTKTTQKIMFLP